MPRSMPVRQPRRFPLLVTAVLFGLLAVPVECSVAMGPHSVFLDPRGVAALQGSSAGGVRPDPGHAGHGHGAAVAARQSSYPHPGADQLGSPEPGGRPSRRATPSDAEAVAAPPSPAELALDAIARILIPDTEHAPPALGSPVRAPTEDLAPPKAVRLGPDPPPPRDGF
jgi:hypothetical protein